MMQDDNTVIEGLGKGKVDYGRAIIEHINRVGKAGCAPLSLNKEARDTFFNGVETLGDMLAPYLDDGYEKSKKDIMSKSEPKDSISTLDEYHLWYALLMKCLRNAGLLPAEERRLMDDNDSEDDIILKDG